MDLLILPDAQGPKCQKSPTLSGSDADAGTDAGSKGLDARCSWLCPPIQMAHPLRLALAPIACLIRRLGIFVQR